MQELAIRLIQADFVDELISKDLYIRQEVSQYIRSDLEFIKTVSSLRTLIYVNDLVYNNVEPMYSICILPISVITET